MSIAQVGTVYAHKTKMKNIATEMKSGTHRKGELT